MSQRFADRQRQWFSLCLLSIAVGLLAAPLTAPANVSFFLLNAVAVAQTTPDYKAEADKLLQQGIDQIQSRQPEKALQPLVQALQIYQKIKHRLGEGNALASLGRAHFAFRSYAKAIEYSEQSLAIARAIKEQPLELAVLRRLGLIYSLTGNHPKAISTVEQTLAIHRKSNNRIEEVLSLGDLGFVYLRAGDAAKAIEVQEKGVQLAQALKDDSLIFHARGNLEETYSVLRGSAFGLWQQGIQQEQANQFEAAIQSWEKALQIYRVIQSRSQELPMGRFSAVDILERLGNTYRSLGNYSKAMEYGERLLAITDASTTASDTRGVVYTNLALSNYSKALLQIEQRLAIAQKKRDTLEEADALSDLGNLYSELGSYTKAIEYHEKSLAIIRKFNNRFREAVVLSYLGNTYYDMGDYPKAISYYKQGLPTHQGPKLRGAHQLHSSMLAYLGSAYYKLGNYSTAIDYYQKSLAIARSINDSQTEASILGNLGNVYSALRNQTKALEYREQGLAIYRRIKDRAGEAIALSALGSIYGDFGNYPEAIESYQKSLVIQQEIKSLAGERISFTDIGSVLEKLRQIDLAIIFYKQAVNVSESIRQDIRALPRELQVSYTGSVAKTYRNLADLLLQQNRIIEAMQVLDLLKVQDLQDFFKDVNGNEHTAKGVEFLPQETAILASINPSSQVSLHARLQDATIQTQVQILQRTAAEQNRRLNAYQDLQARRQRLGKDVALFYPLVLDDRLELVILTEDRPPVRKSVAISAKQLETEIRAFRQQLEARSPQIQPSAQKLYQTLFQPLESDLKAAGVETIVYAPDSIMRYVPLAALHDGTQWLAERYPINYLTALALTPLEPDQNSQSRVLAAALTREQQITLLGKTHRFPALQFTQPEISNLAKILPDTTTLVDQTFNRVNLNQNLPQSTILHLATHGLFVPGSPDQSIMLLGDGTAITLREIEQQWKFPNLSLVVLSACETAIGGKLGNGIEILGFGYQMQRAGSRAALSSLWKVDDGGTQVLMNAFYGALKQGMTKAKAIQAAQKALITGDYTTVGGKRSDLIPESAQTGQSITGDKLTHPHYWAPFILIGNGL